MASTLVAMLAGAAASQANIPQPLVAIHVSESTLALETTVAAPSTPTGVGTTGFEWWQTAWHYHAVYEALEEALRSDGTLFVEVSDSDISAGGLLFSNGLPKYPILISLASEAIPDAAVVPLQNYAAAGGTLFIGSSSLTRRPDGTTREDFALANAMGLHQSTPTLTNWYVNSSFTKVVDHRLVAHIPDGKLNWRMSMTADEIPLGTSPWHPIHNTEYSWSVASSDAQVLAMGDNGVLLSTRAYGAGRIIYTALFNPLMGHGGHDCAMYSYVIFRNAIQWAFESLSVPIVRISPWRYQHDAAMIFRHDFENSPDLINSIEASAQVEYSLGARGDYFFCTGALRENMTNSPETIASLNRAIQDFRATIGPHNGGLPNPGNPTLTPDLYDYWHWGPDEVLDLTPAGYTSGIQYAGASVTNSFNDVELWLGTSPTRRTWASPYFNSTREASYEILDQLEVRTTGEQKVAPFPQRVLSNQTRGKRYGMVSLPTSEWLVGNDTYQALEEFSNPILRACVDAYYDLGGLINIYGHVPSTSAIGFEYLNYSLGKPRIWATNALGIYDWWSLRSTVVATSSHSLAGDTSVVTVNVHGATDPDTSIEIAIPNWRAGVGKVSEVLFNGSPATFRTNSNGIRVRVGATDGMVVASYDLRPTAKDDSYDFTIGMPLTVAPPGLLANDNASVGKTLAAVIANGPSHGSVVLNSNGSFVYTPNVGFFGTDTFAYYAGDGTFNSRTATVTLTSRTASTVYSDDFTRPADPGTVAPWIVQSGLWETSNGVLTGTISPGNNGSIYLSNVWDNFAVQAQIQLLTGENAAAGLGGRVNLTTGARYLALIGPQGSLDSQTILRLEKYYDWYSWSWIPMQEVILPPLGSVPHTLRLAFQDNRITVAFDGNTVIDLADIGFDGLSPFWSGGISADFFSGSLVSEVAVDNVTVTKYESATSLPVLTVTANNLTRAYGQNNPVLTGSLSGVLNGDNLTVSYSTSATAGSNVGSYPIIPSINDPDGRLGDYIVVTNFGMLTVTQAVLTVTALSASKTYDGTATATVTLTDDRIPGDDLTTTYSDAAFADRNAGNDKPITVSGLVLNGPASANYELAQTSLSTTANITVRPITVSATTDSKTYDGTLTSAQAPTITTGSLAPNDTAAFEQFFTDKNAASPKALIPSGAINDGNGGHNYSISFSPVTGAIARRPLTVSASASDKSYDGTANASATLSDNRVPGDSLTCSSGSASFADQNVGSGKTVTIQGITVSGIDADNYTFNSTVATAATITPATLTVAAESASKTYGATNPILSATYTGFIGGDTLASAVVGTPSLTTDATVQSPVGSYPIIAQIGSLSASNYSFTFSNSTLTVAQATLTGHADPKSRAYGQVNPPFTATYSGFVNGETESVLTGIITGTSIADAESPVGDYPIRVGGQSSPNYTIIYVDGTLSITTAPLLVAANNASRIFGQTNPVFSATVTGWVNTNTNQVSGNIAFATIAQTNSPVGTYDIIPSGLVSTNYSITYSNGTLSVTPHALIVSADDQSRTYGAPNPPLTGTMSGLQNGDNVTVSYTTAATTGSAVESYAIVPVLNDPDGKLINYAVSTNNGTLTVTPATLTGRADNKVRTYGQPNPPFTVTYSGFVNGESASIVTGTLSGTSPADVSSPVGSYPISASGQSAPNYTIAYIDGTLSVTAAPLLVTANNASRIFGQTNPIFSATLTGWVSSDTNQVKGTLVYDTTAQIDSPVGTYDIIPGGLTSTNYSITYSNGTLSVTPHALIVSADDQTRTYGAPNPPLTGTMSGLQNGDNVTVTYTTAATTGSAVGSYAIVPVLNDPDGKLINYAVSTNNGTLTVTPATLTGRADNKVRTYGQPNPPFTVTYSGFVNGENASIVTGTISGTSPADVSSPVGSYPISVSGQSAPNYAIAYVDGTLSVTAAPLLVAANNASRIFGQSNPVFSAAITGWVNSDTNQASGTLAFDTVAQTNSPVGTYDIIPGGLTSTNYSVTYSNGTLSITPHALIVSTDSKNRIYGEANPILTGTITGVQNGDNITASYTTTATPASSVGSYDIVPALNDPNNQLANYTVSTSMGTLTIGPATLTGRADNKVRSYGQPNPPFTVTYSGFVNGENASIVTGTASGTSPADVSSPVGSYPISVSGQSALNYDIVYIDGTLSVTPAPLLVAVNNAGRIFGQTNPIFGATFTGWVNSDTNQISGSLVLSTLAQTNSSVGTYEIVPSGLTSTNYSITYSNGTLSVTPHALIVSADDQTRTYGAPNPPLTGTMSGLQNGDNVTVTYTTAATTGSAVGSYAIVPVLNDPDGKLINYAVSTNNGTLTVTPATLTGRADNKVRTYGQPNPPFTVTYSGFVNGENASIVTGTISGTSPADVSSPVGSYPISVSGQSAPNYTIVYEDGTLSVTAAPLLVTADNTSRVFGQTNPVFSATFSGWVNADTNQVSGSLILSTTAQTNSPVGTYDIIPGGLTSTNYSITYSNGTLAITPHALIVSTDSKNRIYGGANPILTGTITGVQNGDNITATYTTTATPASSVGSYDIVPAVNDPDGKLTNYTVTTNNGMLTVTPATLTGRADNKVRTYGQPNPPFTVTYSGFVNGETASIVTGTISGTSPADISTPVGSYPISISGQSAPNYDIVYIDGTLSVTPAPLLVTANDASRIFGQTNPVFSAILTGWVSPDTNQVSGTLVFDTIAQTNSPVGTYDIIPSGLISTNYNITYSNGTLAITPHALVVRVDSKTRVYGAPNPILTGTIDGLQNSDNITVSYTTPAVESSAVGSYPITSVLNDLDNKLANYTLSTNQGILTITPATLTGRADDKTRSYGESNPPFTVTYSGFVNGDNASIVIGSLAGISPANAASPVGSYPISVSGQSAPNYSIVYIDGTLSITPAPLLVTANNASRVFGQTNPAFNATLSGWVNADTNQVSGNIAFTTVAQTNSPVGTYDIIPSGLASTNYGITYSNGMLAITPHALIVTVDDKSRVYGAANPTLTGTIAGLQNGDDITVTYATTATAANAVGSYEILPTLNDPNGKLINYTLITNLGTLTVTPATLTGHADNKVRSYGQPNPPFTVTYSGFVNGEDSSILNGTLFGSSSATTSSPVGSYPIRVSGQSAPNYDIVFTDGILSITPTPLLVTANNASRVFGQANPTFTATLSGWVNADTNQVSGNIAFTTIAQTNSPVGTYDIIPSGLASTNYSITYSNGTLSVTPHALIVSADDQTRTYGAPNPPLTGSITGIQNGDNIIVSYQTAATTGSAVGNYAIVPALDDPDGKLTNYTVTTNTSTLTVTPATLTGRADAKLRTYGQANPPFTVTYSGFVNGENASIVTGTLSGISPADINSPVGSYPISVSGQSALNYDIVYIDGTLSVTPAPLLVAANNASRIFGQTNPIFDATFTGWVNSDTNQVSGSLVLNTLAQTNSPVGTYEIIPSGLTSTNYSITYSNGTLSVTPHALIVSADDQTRTYGAPNPPLTGSITGIQNGDNIIVSYQTAATTGSAVGNYAIVPALDDPDGKLTNYTVTTNTSTLTVTPATLTGRAENKLRTYGQANPPFTVTYSGFVNGENASIITGTLSGISPADINSPVGSYPISVSGQSAPNYAIDYVDGTLSITPTPLLVKANDASRVFGQTNPAFSATLSGWVNADTNQVSGNIAFTTIAQTNSPVGTYDITPSGLTSANYSITYSNGTLTVTPHALIVSADSMYRIYGAANPILTGTITGLQNGDTITANYTTTAGNTSAVGNYTIVPTLNDPNGKLINYTVSTNNGTLTVTPATLTGRADNKLRTYGQANPPFTVTYSEFVNGENASIVAGTLSGISPADINSPVGSYPISVSGQSAPNYVIDYVDGTLSITAAPLLVTANNASRVFGQTNPAFSATLSGWVNADTNQVSGNIAFTTVAQTNSPVGTYDITPSGLTSANYSITYSNGTLTVTPHALIVSADSMYRIYGAANPILTGTITGLQNGDTITANYTTTAGNTSAVGNYTIVPTLNDPNGKLINYTVSTNNGTLAVTPARLTGRGDSKVRSYGQPNPPFTVTYSGFVNGENASIVTGTLSGISPADVSSPVGSYPISVSGQSAPNYVLDYVDGTLSITAAPLLVTANNASRVFGQTNPAFSATLSGWVNADTNQVSGNIAFTTIARTNSPVGTYDITPTGLASANYSITYSNGTLSVTPHALIVSADNQTRTYGAPNPPLTGTFTGLQNGDAITVSYETAASARSAVGSYSIAPVINDPDGRIVNYTLTTNNGTFTVTPATLTGRADNKLRTYGQPNPPFTVTYSGFVNGENASIITGTLSGISPADINSPVGSYPISVSGQSAPNYAIDYVDGTLSITAAPLLVTANNASRVFGQTNPAFSATLSGWVNADTNQVSGNITFTTIAQTNSPVGTYDITPTGLASANYSITYSNGTLSVTPHALIVSADDQTRTYGAPNPQLTGSITGIQNGDNIIVSYQTAATTGSAVGNYAIVPALNDPDGKLINYTVSTNNGTLAVAQAILTGRADSKVRSYGQPNPPFTVTYSGFVNGENASVVTGTLSGTSPVDVSSPVGSYPISVSGQSAPNYAIAYVDGTLSITAAPLLVTANNASRVFGQANPAFSATLSGWVNADTNQVSGNIAFTTIAQTNSPVGTYDITPSGLTSTNYSITYSNGTLAVTPHALIVSADSMYRIYGAANPILTGTITGLQNGDMITANYTTTAGNTSAVGNYTIVPILNDPNGKLINYTVSTNNGTLAVTPARLTGRADNKVRSYGQANPPFTVTYSGFVNGENSSIITGTLSATSTANADSPVGSYPITVWGQSAPNYAMVYEDGTLSVAPAPLLVTANNASRIFGQTNPIFSATFTGWVNSDTSQVSGSLVLSTIAQTNSPVGTYDITPSGLTSANYSITYSNGTLAVTPHALIVSADSKNRIYGATNPTLTGAITGLQNGDTITAGYTTVATPTSSVGSYDIVPTLNDPNNQLANYTVSTNKGTLTVAPATLTIRAENKTRLYGQPNPPFTVTYSGFLNGETASILTGTLSAISTADTDSPVGSYPISVSGQSAPNYAMVYEDGTLSVTPAPLLVTANNASRIFGQTNPIFSATFTGWVNSDTSQVSGSLVLSTIAQTNSPVGTYEITPSGLASTNYSITYSNGTLAVTPHALIVSADAKNRIYGAANPILTGTITGLQNGDTITANYTTKAGSTSAVGNYTIVPTLNDPNGKLINYTVSTNNGTLAVTPARLTGRADNKVRSYGQANPPFTVTYSGFVNGENSSIITGTLSATSTANADSPVGSYPISVSGQSAPNYTVVYVDGALSITAAPLLVTANNASRSFGQTNPTFSATFSGWVNADTNQVSGNITFNTAAQTNSPVGTYEITPSGLASTNYSITYSNGTLSVTPHALIVSADDQARTYGTPNPSLTGTIVGLQNANPITVTYTTTATAASAVGSYVIAPVISDPEGQLLNYSVATNNGTLTVAPATLTGHAENKARSYGQPNPPFTVTYSGFVNGENDSIIGGSLTGTTAADATSPVGSYPISVSGQKAPNYEISYTDGTLSITPAPLLVTANNATRIFGQANPAFSATFTGWVNTDTNQVSGKITFTTVAQTNSPIGTYDIIPSGLTSTNYSITYSNGTLGVTPAKLLVAANDATRSYGQLNPPFDATITGWVNSDTNQVAGILALATTAQTNSPVGTYDIVPSGLISSNYAITYSSGTLHVVPQALTISAADQTRTYSDTNPPLTGTIVGVQNGDNITLTFTTAATPASDAGTYDIVPAPIDPDGKLANYVVTTNKGTLTITAAGSSISFKATQNPSIQHSNIVFVATIGPVAPAVATPTGNVQFFVNGAAVSTPSVRGGLASYSTSNLPVGSNTVAAVYLGDRNFRGCTNSIVEVINAVLEIPQILGIQDNHNGTITLIFSGTPGGHYILQAAEYLGGANSFQSVSTNIVGTDGQWTVTDSSTTSKQRYYRAAKP